jgi:Protein of unknown function (DUF1566)
LVVLASSLSFNTAAQTMGDPNKYSTSPGNTACSFFDGFSDNADGTLTDPRNSLTWQRCAIGQNFNSGSCEGDGISLDWFSAMKTAKESEFRGQKDWRLPTIDELKKIVGNYDGCKDNTLRQSAYAVSRLFGYPNASVVSNTFYDKEEKWSSIRVLSFVTGNAQWITRTDAKDGYDTNDVRHQYGVTYLVRDSLSKNKNDAYRYFTAEYSNMANYRNQKSASDVQYQKRQQQTQSSNVGRGGLRELVWLDGTKAHAARCNNGSSDVFERTALGQYCGGSSADGFKCFSTPSLTAQHICK